MHWLNVLSLPLHSYVLLSNIYSASNRWDDARKVRNLMRAKGVTKLPGLSMIELKGIVHQFMAGDRLHPESEDIYQKLSEISKQLKIDPNFFSVPYKYPITVREENANGFRIHIKAP